VFEPLGVGEHEKRVGNTNEAELPGEKKSRAKDYEREENDEDDSMFQSQTTRSKRAVAFLRVMPVCFQIDDVINGVSEPGNHAEEEKDCQNAQSRRSKKELAVEDKTSENDKIFRPLAGTHGFYQVFQHVFYLTISVGQVITAR